MRASLSVVLLASVLILGCGTGDMEKYRPATGIGRKELATPEPGTYIKPMASAILKEVNQAIEDPGSFHMPPDWIMDLFTARQRKLIDTAVHMEDHRVPLRIYYPSRESLSGNHPLLVYFHGGGFILGSVEKYHPMVSKLARITDHIIVSVDYRLAPDHPFPAALQDSYAALLWVRQHARQLGADPARISVIGDSAGGNIAAVLALKCRDDRVSQPYRQILIYPGLTFVDTITPSRYYFAQAGEKHYVLSEEFMRRVRHAYMGEMKNDRHPYLSPLEAELSPGLAPAFILTAGCDPLRDEGRAYAGRLSEEGVPVRLTEYSGIIHGFLNFHMLLGDARDAMEDIRDYLGKQKTKIMESSLPDSLSLPRLGNQPCLGSISSLH